MGRIQREGLSCALPDADEARLRALAGAPAVARAFARAHRPAAAVAADVGRGLRACLGEFRTDKRLLLAPRQEIQYISADLTASDAARLQAEVSAALAGTGNPNPDGNPEPCQQPVALKANLHVTLFHAARAEAPPAGLLAAADTPLRLAVVGLLDCRPEKELLVAKVQLAGGDLARLGMAGRSGLHITLWHGAGVKAVESNFVPESQPVTAVDVQMVGVVTVH
jgi:hypothetical protein